MKNFGSSLIRQIAQELQCDVHASPFYASEGVELRKQIGNTDTLICMGYFYGPIETIIYQRTESKRGILFRNRLWFLYGWLIKARPRDNQYKVLKNVQTSKFSEQMFVDFVKKEFGAKLP
jgi:hypothetical protein